MKNANIFMLSLKSEVKCALRKNRGAWIWFGLVIGVCIFAWSVGLHKEDLTKASESAVRAAKWSIGDDKQWGKLRGVMTLEAFSKAEQERVASGLGKTIAMNGDGLKTKAWAVERSERAESWVVKGFVKASMTGYEKDEVQWQGAWAARLERQKDGSIKIVKMKMASLPSGLSLDNGLLSSMSE
jgi:hypothetical protein